MGIILFGFSKVIYQKFGLIQEEQIKEPENAKKILEKINEANEEGSSKESSE